jgi:type IV secretory pathway VirB6-like protein
MSKLLIATLTTLFAANVAFAADAGCESKAAEKKLAGAAKSSFMKKCEADAKPVAKPAANADCEAKAKDKKLAGAAKSSFLKKCETDSQAAKPAK